MIHTGEATNVVPDSAEIQGTVRTFTLEVLDLIEQRMREIAEHTAAAFGARCDFEFVRNYPPTINHPAEAQFVRQVDGGTRRRRQRIDLRAHHGRGGLQLLPAGHRPGAYFVIGNGDGATGNRATAWGPARCTTRVTTSTTI
jgi:metal-dependent amidase/aminoacylase/carboxypeptidase family protein